jgi:hypothetical protein
MKCDEICVRDIDFDRISFQCADKFPDNGEREKQEIGVGKEKRKVLDSFEINSI